LLQVSECVKEWLSAGAPGDTASLACVNELCRSAATSLFGGAAASARCRCWRYTLPLLVAAAREHLPLFAAAAALSGVLWNDDAPVVTTHAAECPAATDSAYVAAALAPGGCDVAAVLAACCTWLSAVVGDTPPAALKAALMGPWLTGFLRAGFDSKWSCGGAGGGAAVATLLHLLLGHAARRDGTYSADDEKAVRTHAFRAMDVLPGPHFCSFPLAQHPGYWFVVRPLSRVVHLCAVEADGAAYDLYRANAHGYPLPCVARTSAFGLAC
jgi:hypothetical protein